MVRAIACICFVLLTACAQSTVPTLAQHSSGNQRLTPAVFQEGTPPVRWLLYDQSVVGTFFTGYPVFVSWPVGRRTSSGDVEIAFGATCCLHDNPAPLQAYVDHIPIVPLPANLFAGVPRENGGVATDRPGKVFTCNSGTQICIRAFYTVYGPNGVRYKDQPIMDAAAGAGLDVWYTTCCNGSYIVRANNGARHWYRIPDRNDRLQDVAVTPDGNVWVTIQRHLTNAWILAKLQPSTSVVTEYPLQLQSSPVQLLVGPDKNLWFAIGATLYRVIPATARLTRFTLPKASNGYLTGGSNGTLWLGYGADSSSQGLLEASTTGATLGTFACPPAICTPGPMRNEVLQLTTGPDDNIWFAYSNAAVTSPLREAGGLAIFDRHAINVSPASVHFVKAGDLATITILSEANYSGAWTAISENPSAVRLVKWIDPHHVQIQAVVNQLLAGQYNVIISDTLHNFFPVGLSIGAQ